MKDHAELPVDFEPLAPETMLERTEAFHRLMQARRTVRKFGDRPVARKPADAVMNWREQDDGE